MATHLTDAKIYRRWLRKQLKALRKCFELIGRQLKSLMLRILAPLIAILFILYHLVDYAWGKYEKIGAIFTAVRAGDLALHSQAVLFAGLGAIAFGYIFGMDMRHIVHLAHDACESAFKQIRSIVKIRRKK